MTHNKGYGKLRLRDGRILSCIADCFCEEEDPETCEYICDAILVFGENGEVETLIDDDIIEIIKEI